MLCKEGICSWHLNFYPWSQLIFQAQLPVRSKCYNLEGIGGLLCLTLIFQSIRLWYFFQIIMTVSFQNHNDCFCKQWVVPAVCKGRIQPCGNSASYGDVVCWHPAPVVWGDYFCWCWLAEEYLMNVGSEDSSVMRHIPFILFPGSRLHHRAVGAPRRERGVPQGRLQWGKWKGQQVRSDDIRRKFHIFKKTGLQQTTRETRGRKSLAGVLTRTGWTELWWWRALSLMLSNQWNVHCNCDALDF